MPNMADILVANENGDNVTFTKLVPSAGDRVPARWRVENTAIPAAFRETFDMTSRYNGARTARHIDSRIIIPHYTVDAEGQPTARGNVLIAITAIMPEGIPDSKWTRAVKYWQYMSADALFQSSLKAGYAPT